MGDDDGRFPFGAPNLVSLVPFPSPSPRRLSSGFGEPSRAVPSARKPRAWLSLQGRLVGAQEATSAKAIGGGLGREEAVAWELFSPLHRVLIVSVVAVAAAESKRARRIVQLQRSVDLRDQVLLSMQQKLDGLCDQMNYIKDKGEDKDNDPFVGSEIVNPEHAKFCACGCKITELNPESGIVPLCKSFENKPKDGFGSEADNNEMLKTVGANMVEQEERRMSDLSFCSSVTSSLDTQLSTLATEQDLYILQKECEEKDDIIKEMAIAAQASSLADSKRITELEEIIRRKNMTITKLKKDLVVLEQKVIQLTRLRRPSSAALGSEGMMRIPPMATNLLYDMSSSSSSSDSDNPAEKSESSIHGMVLNGAPQQLNVEVADDLEKSSVESLPCVHKSKNRSTKKQSTSPLREKQIKQRPESLGPRQSGSSSGDFKRFKRRAQSESKVRSSQKRWV